MKVLCTEQGTQEWLRLRQGRITASTISTVLQDRQTAGYRDMVFRLALDLEGCPAWDVAEPGPWMRTGKAFESVARAWYTFETDRAVETTGLVAHDTHDWLACSPDGLIADDGLVEFKVRMSIHTYAKAVRRIAKHDYDQMQCQMLVTGRQWCDYVNYMRIDEVDDERGHIVRVPRDEARIAAIEAAALVMYGDVLALVKARRSTSGMLPV